MLNNFSDIAIVLLLFGVGLTFPISQLRAIGKVGAITAIIEVFAMLGTGFSMAQLGEFSFIVLKVGQDLGATSAFLFPIIGMVVVLTTIFAPFLIKKGTKMMIPY